MKRSVLVVIALAALVSGCAKEVGRVPFAHDGNGDGTMTLAAGDASFWTDIDIDFEGDASMQYQIELVQHGAIVGKTTCDPLAKHSVKTSWVETNIGDHHTRSGNGKMDCTIKLASGGPTDVRAHLSFLKKPRKMILKKADLAVRQ